MVYYNLTSYNSDMFLTNILSWWYTAGLVKCFDDMKYRLLVTADLFSIGLLFETLFAPFRQISAGGGGSGPIGVQVRALFDNLISRLVGFFVRFLMIIIGIIVLFLQIIASLVYLIFWVIFPFMPVAGLVLSIVGINII